MKVNKIIVWNIVLVLFLAMLLSACSSSKSVSSGSSPGSSSVPSKEAAATQKPLVKLKLGFAKCAHCLPMALTPELAKNVELDAINFPSGNDVLTALVSKSIDIAQVTYLHYITALDKDFDVVAISGQVNGGSDLLLAPGISLKEDDWDGFKKMIDEYKKQNKPFRVGASRGNAQDIHMRGELQLHGIDPIKDVQIINIPNPSDHAAALKRGEVEMLSTVEPFASQIRLEKGGSHFAFPYGQAAGKLTNLIVTRKDVIKDHPKEVEETVASVVRLVEKLDKDRAAWLQVINKYTAMDEKIGTEALKNAYPDFKMYRKSTLAMVSMMKDLKYISNDVTDKAEKSFDYSFLSKVTGKSKEELGYN